MALILAVGKQIATNSLIGGLVNDQIGDGTPIALTNGNVVFRTSKWGALDTGLVIEITGTAMSAGILTE